MYTHTHTHAHTHTQISNTRVEACLSSLRIQDVFAEQTKACLCGGGQQFEEIQIHFFSVQILLVDDKNEC